MRPEPGKKLDKMYGQYLLGTAIFSVVMFAAVAAVMAFLFLNFVFVFPPEFSHTDVPFYIEPIDDAPFRQATRYGVNYVLLTLTSLKFGSIFFTFGALVVASRGGDAGWLTAASIWNGAVALYDLGISIYWLILVFQPSKCAAANLCRSWNATPTDSVDDAGVANWTFELLAWNGIGFLVMHAVYLFVLLKFRTIVSNRQRILRRQQNASVA